MHRTGTTTKRIIGDDGSSLYSGPKLPPEETIRFNGPKWKDWQQLEWGPRQITVEARLVGILADASQPNDRVGLVEMHNGDYYLFVYTGRSRDNGMNIKGFRDLITLWFRYGFIAGSFRPGGINQAVNLDGGSSIHVSWNDGSGGEPVRIAEGNVHDETLTSSEKKVANLIKITPGVPTEG